jgi:hypothetical protein
MPAGSLARAEMPAWRRQIWRRCGGLLIGAAKQAQTIESMLNQAFTMARQGSAAKITHFDHDSNQDSSPRGFIKNR